MSQLAAHHAQARFVALPSGDVAVLDATPTSVPRGTALLVPGFTGSKEDFAPILDPLREAGYRTVAFDLPGQYQSPGPDDRSRYTPDTLAQVVNQLAGTLGDEPVHLLGHSFGGLVARAAVLAGPDRYRSLVLLCSGPAAMDHGRGALLARLEPYAGDGMAAVFAAMQEFQPPDPPLPDDLAAFMRRRFLASTVAGFFGISAALGGEPDRIDALRDTGVPTLVCFGERDTGWPLAQQRDMAGRLGAQLTVVAEAGHSPALDRPTQTTAALTAFWAAHTSTVPGTP